MVKIFIDPGHGGSDPGAIKDGLQEKQLTLKIASEMKRMLLAEFMDVSVRMSRSQDESISLSDRAKAANRWEADLYVSIHINAGGGTGFETYVYPKVDKRTKTFQDTIHSAVLNQVDFIDRGMKSASFYVLRETKMPAILTENGFIDTTSDANKLKDNSFIQSVAIGHVNGISQALNLNRKINAQNQLANRKSNAKYKVQIGAFTNRKHAEKLAERAKRAGIEVIIKNE